MIVSPRSPPPDGLGILATKDGPDLTGPTPDANFADLHQPVGDGEAPESTAQKAGVPETSCSRASRRRSSRRSWHRSCPKHQVFTSSQASCKRTLMTREPPGNCFVFESLGLQRAVKNIEEKASELNDEYEKLITLKTKAELQGYAKLLGRRLSATIVNLRHAACIEKQIEESTMKCSPYQVLQCARLGGQHQAPWRDSCLRLACPEVDSGPPTSLGPRRTSTQQWLQRQRQLPGSARRRVTRKPPRRRKARSRKSRKRKFLGYGVFL